MGKFATDVLGNIDSGTEVLANNMVFLQQTKEKDISNLFGDLFLEGIININMGTAQNPKEPFKLTQGTVAGKFSVDIGVAYCQDSDGIYRRIAIENLVDYHNEIFGDTTYPDGMGINQKTFDGVDTYINTPKSSGCLNIDIPAQGITYYVDLRYVNVCDNGNDGTGLNLTNYSIAKNLVPSSDQRKRFYKWVDGYNIALITDLSEKQGIILGTVQNNSGTITTTLNGRSSDLLINSNVFMNYLAAGSGISIVDYEDGKRLSVNVDNITLQIEDNKVRATKDSLYPYTKFSVNSGHVDSNNNPDILLTDTVGITINFGVGTQVPLVVSPAYNDKYSILPTDTISNILSVRDTINQEYSETEGTYTVCINNTNKDDGELLEYPKLELLKTIYVSKENLATLKGNLWLDISSEPFKAKWFNGGSWVEYHGIPLGEAIVTDSTITVTSFDFSREIKNDLKVKNFELYNTKTLNEAANINLDGNNYLNINNINGLIFNSVGNMTIDGISNTLSITNFDNVTIDGTGALNFSNFSSIRINNNPLLRLPDYSTKVSNVATSSPSSNDDSNPSHQWTATNDGWIQVRRAIGNSGSDDAWFKINNQTIYSFDSNSTDQVSGFYPIKKGDIIQVRRGFSVDFYSYR